MHAKVASDSKNRILRHFMCDDCNELLDIITGDSSALLAECPKCEKQFNIVVVKVPLKKVKLI